jgi:hypothetical protein
MYTKVDEIVKELWKIRNPHIKATEELLKKLKNKIILQKSKEHTKFPFTKKSFFEVTTGRNRNLINPDEQHMLRNTVVAFFGLSVGSHGALTWMMESRADVIKIVDPDIISLSNLNRLRLGIVSVGNYKVDEIAKALTEINPFASVISYKESTHGKITEVISKGPEVNVIVDEIDNFQDKILLRVLAREKKIPLISAADVGDNIIIDIERYDVDKNLQPFLGRIKNVEKIDFSSLSEKEKMKLIIQLVGFEKNSERMIDSLFAIGASIPTWPQLGATATISGGVITTLIKKIVLGEQIKSGRYYISLDDIFVSNFNSFRLSRTRNKKISHIKKMLENL